MLTRDQQPRPWDFYRCSHPGAASRRCQQRPSRQTLVMLKKDINRRRGLVTTTGADDAIRVLLKLPYSGGVCRTVVREIFVPQVHGARRICEKAVSADVDRFKSNDRAAQAVLRHPCPSQAVDSDRPRGCVPSGSSWCSHGRRTAVYNLQNSVDHYGEETGQTLTRLLYPRLRPRRRLFIFKATHSAPRIKSLGHFKNQLFATSPTNSSSSSLWR